MTNYNTSGASDMSGDANAPQSDEATRQLNSFLRGEISAAETYRMAIEKVSDTDNTHAANLGRNDAGHLFDRAHGRARKPRQRAFRQVVGERQRLFLVRDRHVDALEAQRLQGLDGLREQVRRERQELVVPVIQAQVGESRVVHLRRA